MKCSSCSNEATGTFWVAYHNSTEIVLVELLCEECTWKESEFWYFACGEPRETGFIPKFFSDNSEKVWNFLNKNK